MVPSEVVFASDCEHPTPGNAGRKGGDGVAGVTAVDVGATVDMALQLGYIR